MFPRFTGALLLGLFALALSLSQAGLKYCVCIEEFFVGACACPSGVVVEAGPRDGGDSVEQGHCCSESISEEIASKSCPVDCDAELDLNLGEFTSPTLVELRIDSEDPEKELATASNSSSFSGVKKASVSGNAVTESSAPPPREALYLRHSVFLV